MTPEELRDKIKRLSWFSSYHSFQELGISGKREKNNSRINTIFSHIDCTNKTVLDLGCNLGRICIEASRRGANEVVGVDCQLDTIECAQEIACLLGVASLYKVVNLVSMEEVNLLPSSDVIFFLSVLDSMNCAEEHKYQLLSTINQKTREVLVFEGHRPSKFRTRERYMHLLQAYTTFTKIEEYSVIDQDRPGKSARKTRPLFICRR
jgi:2-polyprenyl-3-methyl-5-hydroxy-6-metoxy-1,4-benzoquinol methylase